MPPEQDLPTPTELSGGAPSTQDTASTPAPDTASAPGTQGVQDEAPTSLLAAVERVLDKKPEDAATAPATDPQGSPPQAETPDTTTEPNAESEDGDPTPEELAAIQKPSVRARMERLLAQRNEARDELASLQPDAQNWRSYSQWVQETGFTQEEHQQLLGIGALLKAGRFQEVYPALKSYMDAVEFAIGHRLPADLQQQVDDGVLPDATARELAQTRARAGQAEQRVAAANANLQSVQTERAAAAVHNALSTWEANVARRDADYSHKQELLMTYVRAELGGRTVMDPREAVQIADRCMERVNQQFRRMRPAPAATPLAPVSGHTPPRATPEPPKTLEDAIFRAIG